MYRLDLPVGDPEYGRIRRCACRLQEDVRTYQALSGLSSHEQRVRLEDIVIEAGGDGTRRMVEAARDFVTDPCGMLTISGTPGNAKTVALQGVVNALVGRGIPAVYVTMFDLIGYIRKAFYQDDRRNLRVSDDDAYSRLKRFEQVRVLAVDEFDKVKLTDWVLEQMTDLVDVRYRHADQLGTLVAMNSGLDVLPDWIASRLRDGRNVVVVNNDPDLRPEMR